MAEQERELGEANAPLERALEPGEAALWSGPAVLAGERVLVMLTAERLIWTGLSEPSRWSALSQDDLAAGGMVIPRATMLTVAFAAAGSPQRLEFRSAEGTDFSEMPWSRDMLARIAETLEASDEVGAQLRGTLLRAALTLAIVAACAIVIL